MSKSSYVDFRAVKAAITMQQVLEHYDLLGTFKKSGDSLSGPCPIHKGSNPTQFRVSLSKNVWNCFSECKHGGNTLDFIVRMEGVSIHAAAIKAVEWFNLDREQLSTSRKPDDDEASDASTESPQTKLTAKPVHEPENTTPNKPLKFRLEKLDRQHAYVSERGLTQETAIDFGIGYCAKGVMEGRIAIPIHNSAGEVVAYCGRFPGEPEGDTPKYKLPPGFRKSMELFNIDHAIKEPADQPFILVEGFFDCMKLHQHGYRKVIALMGSTMSAAQENLLRQHLKNYSQVVIMLDEDEAGKAGREDIAVRLSKYCFVKVHAFETEGKQPEQLTADEVRNILEVRS